MRKIKFLSIILTLFLFSYDIMASEECDYEMIDLTNELQKINDVVMVGKYKSENLSDVERASFGHYLVFFDNSMAVVKQENCYMMNLTIGLYSNRYLSDDVKIDRINSIVSLYPIKKSLSRC